MCLIPDPRSTRTGFRRNLLKAKGVLVGAIGCLVVGLFGALCLCLSKHLSPREQLPFSENSGQSTICCFVHWNRNKIYLFSPSPSLPLPLLPLLHWDNTLWQSPGILWHVSPHSRGDRDTFLLYILHAESRSKWASVWRGEWVCELTDMAAVLTLSLEIVWENKQLPSVLSHNPLRNLIGKKPHTHSGVDLTDKVLTLYRWQFSPGHEGKDKQPLCCTFLCECVVCEKTSFTNWFTTYQTGYRRCSTVWPLSSFSAWHSTHTPDCAAPHDCKKASPQRKATRVPYIQPTSTQPQCDIRT